MNKIKCTHHFFFFLIHKHFNRPVDLGMPSTSNPHAHRMVISGSSLSFAQGRNFPTFSADFGSPPIITCSKISSINGVGSLLAASNAISASLRVV